MFYKRSEFPNVVDMNVEEAYKIIREHIIKVNDHQSVIKNLVKSRIRIFYDFRTMKVSFQPKRG